MLCGFSVIFKHSIGKQKCFVQDMAAKFPSLKQCRVRIVKLGWDNTVTVRLEVKYLSTISSRSTSYLQLQTTEMNPLNCVSPTVFLSGFSAQILHTNRILFSLFLFIPFKKLVDKLKGKVYSLKKDQKPTTHDTDRRSKYS